ncbi:MAG: hypothetical protein L6R41_002373 [Letrouitia leprolyta]|nr:MAG: hypothetical protein L6R41_002373 [Letrouitia leprolyta]
MRFGYTILYVQNVRLTLEFYAEAFGFSTRFVLPTNDYGELNLQGGTTLAFAAEDFAEKSIGAGSFRPNRKIDAAAAGAEISFVVDEGEDVEDVFQKAVKAGASLVKHPAQKPWGQTVAYVRDCNGFLVELCTPVGGNGDIQ